MQKTNMNSAQVGECLVCVVTSTSLVADLCHNVYIPLRAGCGATCITTAGAEGHGSDER